LQDHVVAEKAIDLKLSRSLVCIHRAGQQHASQKHAERHHQFDLEAIDNPVKWLNCFKQC
jgi:hypothetical protein